MQIFANVVQHSQHRIIPEELYIEALNNRNVVRGFFYNSFVDLKIRRIFVLLFFDRMDKLNGTVAQ